MIFRLLILPLLGLMIGGNTESASLSYPEESAWVSAYISADSVHLYAEDDTTSAFLILNYGQAVSLDVIPALEDGNSFYLTKVTFGKGGQYAGYVHKEYLADHLSKIPARSLYNYYSYWIPDLYVFHYEEELFSPGYDYYGENWTEPMVKIKGETLNLEEINFDYKDTIRDIISLELVENLQYLESLVRQIEIRIDTFIGVDSYISPRGHFVVDFHNSNDAVLGCRLNISHLKRRSKFLSVNFKSWGVVGKPNSAFWISDNELILKVIPIDNMIPPSSDQMSIDVEPRDKNMQYLKLTIL